MLGAVGVMIGLPLADPIIGLLIAISIVILLWGIVRSIGRRLMDGIDPALVERAEHTLEHTPGVISVPSIKLRWVGHRLHGSASIQVQNMALTESEAIVHDAEHRLGQALPNLDDMEIRAVVSARP